MIISIISREDKNHPIDKSNPVIGRGIFVFILELLSSNRFISPEWIFEYVFVYSSRDRRERGKRGSSWHDCPNGTKSNSAHGDIWGSREIGSLLRGLLRRRRRLARERWPGDREGAWQNVRGRSPRWPALAGRSAEEDEGLAEMAAWARRYVGLPGD